MNILINEKTEKKCFYIFLAVHLIVWSSIGLIRTVLPTDALEGIYWGSFMDLGTPKHPPLFGWLAYLTYLPFKTDYVIYFVSQLFVIFGFIYTYKLAKCFLDENKAMLSVIILEGCWVYSYITGYWTDYEKMKKLGVMVVDRTPEMLIGQALNTIPYLDKNIEIKPVEYKFNVQNALGQSREYTIYYYIVPPVNNSK